MAGLALRGCNTYHATVLDAAEILGQARRQAGYSIRDLADRTGRSPSTISRIEAGATDPAISLFEELLIACGWLLEPRPSALNQQPSTEVDVPSPPTTYPNPRDDDPWDNDAVHWLLDQPGVATSWKRGPLFECLRRQPARLRNQPARVEKAARLAKQFGVRQVSVYDANIGKTLVRLVRTDDAAPTYPWPTNAPDAT